MGLRLLSETLDDDQSSAAFGGPADPALPQYTLFGPAAPREWPFGLSRVRRALYWDQEKSYLEQPSSGSALRERGVHYVRWRDVFFNVAARPKFGGKLLGVSMVAALFTANAHFQYFNFLDIQLDKDTLGLFFVGIMYLLGQRLSWSYERYDEARKLWGNITCRSRDLNRQFYCYCPDRVLTSKLNRWTVAFAIAIKQHLQWLGDCQELQGTLRPEELAAFNASNHMPVHCMGRLSDCIREARQQGHIDPYTAMRMDENLTSFADSSGSMERILKTPVPFGLVLHLRSMILLYLFLLPLHLAATVHLAAVVPIVVVCAYTLSGFEDLSREMENPFRPRWHGLPMALICRTINADLTQIREFEEHHTGAAAAGGAAEGPRLAKVNGAALDYHDLV